MISPDLARELRDAGLEWIPSDGDKFVIPDRDLDDRVFSVSEMTIEVKEMSAGGRRISFNGAVEWALDSIMQSEVVWMPSEEQLRARLGRAFHSIEREGDRYHCVIEVEGDPEVFTDPNPADAYGKALLDLLRRDDVYLRLLLRD